MTTSIGNILVRQEDPRGEVAKSLIRDYRVMRLETGFRQPAAIALYERYGFHRIPPFGRYLGDPVSVCYEKGVVKA